MELNAHIDNLNLLLGKLERARKLSMEVPDRETMNTIRLYAQDTVKDMGYVIEGMARHGVDTNGVGDIYAHARRILQDITQR